MDHIAYTLFTSDPGKQEILVSLLAEEGFESFSQEEDRLTAYIREDALNSSRTEKIISDHDLTFSAEKIEQRNWNEEWEKNYPPVVIAGRCHIRAPFHSPEPGMEYEILIEPKMAFGTAHHETTALMIGWLLETDLAGKKVLDMGCGTGVLAILAEMKGARSVLAVDNDEWAYRNAVENVTRNNCTCTTVEMGDVNTVSGQGFDVILANINRNVLLDHLPVYGRLLESHGELFISGFYRSDLPVLKERAAAAGLRFDRFTEKNEWAAARFVK